MPHDLPRKEAGMKVAGTGWIRGVAGAILKVVRQRGQSLPFVPRPGWIIATQLGTKKIAFPITQHVRAGARPR